MERDVGGKLPRRFDPRASSRALREEVSSIGRENDTGIGGERRKEIGIISALLLGLAVPLFGDRSKEGRIESKERERESTTARVLTRAVIGEDGRLNWVPRKGLVTSDGR